MGSNRPILGKTKLFTDLQGMPCDGLTALKIRVELLEDGTPDSAWVSELSVLGSLPWREDDERSVEVRILAEEFREYVLKQKPELNIT